MFGAQIRKNLLNISRRAKQIVIRADELRTESIKKNISKSMLLSVEFVSSGKQDALRPT